jgi:hypothetical protein
MLQTTKHPLSQEDMGKISPGNPIIHFFQQYFSYIVAVSFIGGEDHRHVESYSEVVSHNVVYLALTQI